MSGGDLSGEGFKGVALSVEAPIEDTEPSVLEA
jgi:hypothetical protein